MLTYYFLYFTMTYESLNKESSSESINTRATKGADKSSSS